MIENRVFFLPYLHSTAPLWGGGPRQNISA